MGDLLARYRKPIRGKEMYASGRRADMMLPMFIARSNVAENGFQTLPPYSRMAFAPKGSRPKVEDLKEKPIHKR
jgi:hypothetical protein